jgi:hypothetical protein
VEKVDGEGAQLDRNAVQRDGTVSGPSPYRSSVLLGPGGPGKPVILLVHNLIRSRVLLRMAGVEL